MILFNTTYFVADEVRDDFLKWIRCVYVPRATAERMLLVPQLTRIIGSERDGGVSFALQFRALSVEAVETWKEVVGNSLNQAIADRYANRVVGFSTLMEKLDI